MASKKKLVTAGVALATSAALLLGGTFAWQSINQTALNEASDVINPGGRLHDDFNGENKDIYVENFADEPIYARIQLSEYFEIIANYGAGEGIETSTQLLGSKNDDGTYNYTLFNNYASLTDGTLAAGVNGDYDETAEEGAEGYAYWSWKTGGQTIYMPTFNLNKDSLAADINGIYEDGNVGTISDRILDMTDPNAQYSEYKEYTDGETLSGDEIYDADANNVEEEDGSGTTTVSGVEHTAKPTGDATLISMADWNGEAGPYWVYDTDGWVYWAQAIEPGTATGLLLDGIELNQVMDDTWYYAINVVAQFVTANDVGKTDGTGFYDAQSGTVPSGDAETLLAAIGVDMSGDTAGGDEGDEDWDDEGGDDDYSDPHFNIEYAGMNENNTIYMSAADFATNGAGLSFTSFLGETGEYAYAADAEWQLEDEDENDYNGVEKEEDTSTFTVNVNKEAEALSDGDQFKFAVTTTNALFPGESFTVNMTVIIGEAPTDDSEITDSVALQNALNVGGTIDLPDTTIQTGTEDDAVIPNFDDSTTADYVWTEGGTVNGGTIDSTSGSSHTLFINNENNWPADGDGANAATMNDTTINAYSRFAIYAQAVDAPITLNNMNITNDYGGGILAEYSQPITLNNLTVSAGNQDAYEWINTALAAAQGANVEINGGTYTGNNAVLILSSGANVTINGGTFNGNIGFASDVSESVKENSSLVINGGTFTVDPSDYVNTDTHTVTDNGDDTWSVQEKSAETITLTYTVVEPADWDGALARRDETSVTLKVDGDYTADDLEWSLPDSGGADCISAEGIVEHEDGSATITHVGSICGGGGGTVRVSLTSDLSVYLDINIGCDT